MYYSNEDFENFYVRYKAEGLPRRLTIQEFCIRNNVPWNLFHRWYCNTRQRIQEVTVTGRPEPQDNPQSGESGNSTEAQAQIGAPGSEKSGRPGISVSLQLPNGLQICQENLDYRTLRSLVEKLEALC